MNQEYYMGLDMGTGSLGWAITDTDYHILRRHGKALWGVRLFESALTAEEIQATNHFYTIEPESEGLIAYWKFDEGSGTVAKDYSVSGYDLTIEKEPKWESVSLPQ